MQIAPHQGQSHPLGQPRLLLAPLLAQFSRQAGLARLCLAREAPCLAALEIVHRHALVAARLLLHSADVRRQASDSLLLQVMLELLPGNLLDAALPIPAVVPSILPHAPPQRVHLQRAGGDAVEQLPVVRGQDASGGGSRQPSLQALHPFPVEMVCPC